MILADSEGISLFWFSMPLVSNPALIIILFSDLTFYHVFYHLNTFIWSYFYMELKDLIIKFVNRDVHLQIIRRVITHRTICFYSPNTLFFEDKWSPIKFLSFIFQLFKVKTISILKKTLHNLVKMNCTMCNYTPYNLYMDVPSLYQNG